MIDWFYQINNYTIKYDTINAFATIFTVQINFKFIKEPNPTH